VNSVQRVARNSLIPMAAQLVNKLVDLAFALLVYRLLGPDGAGRYEFAIVLWLYVKTISDFGLGLLATREVARRPASAGQWLGAGVTLRLLMLLATVPLVAALLGAYAAADRLPVDLLTAAVLLLLSIAPAALADSATAIFNAREEMVMPALLTILSTVLKVLLAGAALLAGSGIVGLAGAAVAVNLIAGAILWRLVRRHVPRVAWWPGVDQTRHWLALAWPLLLNNLLASLFFRLDTYVIQFSRGPVELGLYSAAYKFINFTLILPPYLTMALFPGLARQAERDPAALRRTLRLAIGYLVMLALPGALATTALAEPLIWVVGGDEFLPGSATALRLLIWFLPFSYVNGLLQYALIALNRQRTITLAFGLTVVFNLVANVALVPAVGYMAAALVTVASEVVLLVPLLVVARRALGALDLVAVLWRPIVAAGVMAVVLLLTASLGPWLATLLAGAAYLATLAALGAWGEEEQRLARALLGRTSRA
jgi:O-antigen/teichoic acid export membrane protein